MLVSFLFKIRVKLLALIRLHAMGEIVQFYDTLLTYISFVACVVLCAYPRCYCELGKFALSMGRTESECASSYAGGGRGLGPMSSKQLGEFIDQKALHGYGDLPGHVAAPSQHSKPTERAPKSLRLRLSCSRNSSFAMAFPISTGFLPVTREVHMSSQQYREFAKECLLWAEETTSDEDRKHFAEMAKAWMHATAELENSKNSPVQAAELAGGTLCQTEWQPVSGR